MDIDDVVQDEDEVYENPQIRHLVFSPSGQVLAAVTKGWNVHIWDMMSPAAASKLHFLSDVRQLAFISDTSLATSSSRYIVRIWDLDSEVATVTWELDDPEFRAVRFLVPTFSSDAQLFAFYATDDDCIHVRETISGREMLEKELYPNEIFLCSDGRHLGGSYHIAGFPGMRMWDVTEEVKLNEKDDTPQYFSPNRGRPLTTPESEKGSGAIRVWDLTAWQEFSSPEYDHTYRFDSTSF